VVTRQQADPGGAVLPREVAELLVGQRLQRGRVEGLAVVGERPFHGELGHYGLTRAGGGGHQDGLAGVQGLDALDLEPVQGERVALGEAFERGHRVQYRGCYGLAARGQNVTDGRGRGGRMLKVGILSALRLTSSPRKNSLPRLVTQYPPA